MQARNAYEAAGLWLSGLGATVTAIREGDKRPAHKWKHYYTQGGQTTAEVRRLPWAGYDGDAGRVEIVGVGVCSGLNAWRCFDLDWFKGDDGRVREGRVEWGAVVAILRALGLPEDYPWVVLSGSGTGYSIWFRCEDALPEGALPAPPEKAKAGKATYWGRPHDGKSFDHLELRWSGCQTLLPPSAHPSGGRYEWVNGQPEDAPATVSAGQVLAAFLAVAKPVEPRGQADRKPFERAAHRHPTPRTGEHSGRDLLEQLAERIDVPSFVRRAFSGDVVLEPNGEIRVLGHGGFMLRETSSGWIWNIFSEGQGNGDYGGDLFDLLGYSIFGDWTPEDRKNATKWRAVLDLAAREAGMVLPDKVEAGRSTLPTGPTGKRERLTSVPSSGDNAPGGDVTTDSASGQPHRFHGPRLTPEQVLGYIERQEVGDAEALAELYRGEIAFDPTEDRWYLWNGTHWEEDRSLAISRRIYEGLAAEYAAARHALSEQYTRLASPGSGASTADLEALTAAQADIHKRVKAILTARRMDNTLKILKSMVSVPASKWDARPYLLPVANGVVDLTTGALLPPNPDYYLRTAGTVEYRGLETPAPRWERFLEEVFADKTPEDRVAIIRYLQQLLGYCLTGDTRTHHFSIWWGEQGRNGKGTILSTVQFIMGRMAGKVSKEVLVQRKAGTAGGPQQHLYDLKGKRLAYVDELGQNDRLDMGQVKELTGGGTVKARPLYGRGDEWEATHHLILSTNYRPEARADDEAFWQRASIIEFRMRFLQDPDPNDPRQRPQDPDLAEALRREAPGILAWLVRGCLEWQRNGRRLVVPECIKAYTKSYREDEDEVGAFIADECELEPDGAGDWSVRAGELYEKYRAWAESMGIKRPMTNQDFGQQVKRLPGVQYVRSNAGRWYLGIRLRVGPARPPRATKAEPERVEQVAMGVSGETYDAGGLVERLRARKTA